MGIVYNWHISEMCNYSCTYCFAKWNHSEEIWKCKDRVFDVLSGMENSHNSPFLKKIKQSGDDSTVRVNFAGGEPLMLGRSLIKIIRAAKDTGLRTSIISNGSLLYKYRELAKYVDMIGISIDSLSYSTNKRLRRCTKKGIVLDLGSLSDLVTILRETNPKNMIKINIVVNRENYQESIIPSLERINPYKIKVLREMPFGEGEKGISNEMFQSFMEANPGRNVFFEDNSDMTQSYLMIDPMGRFFQNGNNSFYTYSCPIHEICFENALSSIEFDDNCYINRYKRGKK